MMNQGFILRFLSLKSVKETRKTYLALILVLMPLSALAVSNAVWLGRSMVSQGLLPADVDPNQIFVLVAGKICQPGVFGFVMAALTAALMSTIDTLINAVSAITVNDIYRPFVRQGASDGHYLKVARLVTLSSAIFGIALVPVFASFNSIYVAHGAFTAAITPAMVTTIVLGAYWKRFTPAAAFWTLVAGSVMVILSIFWPVIITPLAHGVDPSGGFKYMRALYGLVISLGIAIVVTMKTRPKLQAELAGLTVGTLESAKMLFKGAPINEREGKKVDGSVIIDETVEEISIPSAMADQMKAEVGDIIYLADSRWWLGGLRSVHTPISAIHGDDESAIRLTSTLVREGSLLVKRRHTIEKII